MGTHSRTWWARLVPVVIACALLAGCGGSGKSTTASSPTAPGTAVPGTGAATTTTTPPRRVVATSLPWHLDRAMSRMVCGPSGSSLRCAGGLNVQDISMDRVFVLDPSDGKVTDAGRLPTPIHDAAGATLGTRTLQIGGGHGLTGSADVVDITAATARQVGTLPQPLSDIAAATVGDTAYVVGGYNGSTIAPTVLASRDGYSFRSVATLHTPVRYAAVIAIGRQLFVFGGKTHVGPTDSQTADIQRVNLDSGDVAVVGHFPTPIGHMSAATLNGDVYLIGGRTGTTTETVSATIWQFDPATGAVTAVGALPHPIADTTVVTLVDRILVLGGETPTTTADVMQITQVS